MKTAERPKLFMISIPGKVYGRSKVKISKEKMLNKKISNPPNQICEILVLRLRCKRKHGGFKSISWKIKLEKERLNGLVFIICIVCFNAAFIFFKWFLNLFWQKSKTKVDAQTKTSWFPNIKVFLNVFVGSLFW